MKFSSSVRPAFHRLVEKYAFQGGEVIDPLWMKEAQLPQEMEIPAARIESISAFFAPSPFLRPETDSLTFSVPEQSRESKLRLNLKNFHRKKGTKRGLGFRYPLDEICKAR